MKSKQTWSAMRGTILTMCALTLSASLAFAGSNKISKDQTGKTSGQVDGIASHKISKDLVGKASGQVDVIVQFKQAPTAYHHEKVLSRGGKIKRELGRFKGGAYTMPASALEDLANDPDVVYITPDRPLSGASTSSSAWTLDYHSETINTSAATAVGLDGTGIGVAIIDSGVANVPDLTRSNVVFSQDFTGDKVNGAADQYGHGTHVAGIIAGNGNASTGPNDFYTFKGIAPNVSIVNLRVLDVNGSGSYSEVIAAIQTAIQLRSTYNIRVINLSLGGPVWESYTADPLCQAVEQAWQAGITVVVAAGNYGRDNNAGTTGYGTITSPGNDPYVITVGAMNTMGTPDRTDDVPATYSSKGPTFGDQVIKPDLVAPGNLIVSLYTPADTLNQENPGNEAPTSLYQTNGTGATSSSYFILSGTSMATPMVTGAAALMLQQNPDLTPDQVKAALMLTAFKGLQQYATITDPTTGQTFNEQADVFTVGAGYLDIQAALANTNLAPPTVGSALSPFAVEGPNGNVALVVNGPSVLGSNAVLWGTGAMWGNAVLWGTGSTAGEAVLWGTDSTAGEAVLWGTGSTTGEAVLWGTGTAAGEAVLWGTGSTASEAVLWGTGSTAGTAVLWGTGSALDQAVAVLWGTSSLQANSVLWGTKN